MLTGAAKSHVLAFFKAVATGSLAAASPGLLFTVPLGLLMVFKDGQLSGLSLVLAPLIVAVPSVFAASLLLGLPLTAVLARIGKERGEHYVVAGLVFGTLPFLGWMFLSDEANSIAALAVLGAFGGGATGWVWGRHREGLMAQQSPE